MEQEKSANEDGAIAMNNSNLHSSIQMDLSVPRYSGERCKYYYLPLHQTSEFRPEIVNILGAANKYERSFIDIKSSLIKAKKSHCSHVKVPLDRVKDELLLKVINEAEELNLGIVLQICTSLLRKTSYVSFLKQFSNSFEIEFVFDGSEFLPQITELTEYFSNFHFTVPVHKNLDWRKVFFHKIFKIKNEIHIYFPYQVGTVSPYLTCQESHKVLALLRKYFPEIDFLPPKGVDIWDHRVLCDFDMDPFILPCFITQSKNPLVKYSVVIPTYNNQNHLRVTLRHLFKQNVGLDYFEIIIVDDGGTDQTQELVMKLIEDFGEAVNLKYIFFPRPRKRVMGDSQYRAGISRNLGVKNAVGEILCFLDSDIVTPESYLRDVGENLKKWDAVQAKRVNLGQNASTLECDYNKIDEKLDLTPDEAYWEEFIRTKEPWHELPYNWKYVCTHSFSMRRDLFWKIGGLKKNFIFYGFEDTDLGYRLTKRGYKLHLLDVKVYHLFHENARSEFMNLKSLRHNLLSKTAQIFYLHHLDEDIYKNLLSFMEPEPTLKRFVLRFFKLLSLQFLWKPKEKVFQSLQANLRTSTNEMD